MKNFGFILIVFVLVISIFLIFMQADQREYSTASLMEKAFDATGAKVVSSEIYIRGRLTAGQDVSEEARQQLLKEIISTSGGDIEDEEPAFLSVDNDIGFGTEANYIINDNSRIHISIIKDLQKNNQEDFHLSISLFNTSSHPNAERSVEKLTEVLKRNHIDPDFNISITGSVDGNLDEEEMNVLYDRAFDSIQADKVEGIKDDGLTSISAFAPSIKNAIRVNGQRVNLNMATRYNSYEGKTYIWLATPVITTEY